MPRTKKSWSEKMNAKPPHYVVLEKDFAGVKKGSKLYISCPLDIASALTRIPKGKTMAVQEFRRTLAKANHCDATCPVSTALFLRIVAEYAWERMQAGADIETVPPFWRVIEPDSTIAKKLSLDQSWIALQRSIEAN